MSKFWFENYAVSKYNDAQRAGLAAVLVFRVPSAWHSNPIELLKLKLRTKAE
jgi:hypothetical protein